MGMPGQFRADPKTKKTDLRSESKGKNRDAGARDGDSASGRFSDNRERCREEWVRFGLRVRVRAEELIEEMKKYRLEVLGVSKTKMKGNGSKVVGEGKCIFTRIEEERQRLESLYFCQRARV